MNQYWPLIGVLIGWLLNTITNHSKFKLEQKLLRGKALTYLMIIYDQLSIVNNQVDELKKIVKLCVQYEKQRIRLVNKHLLPSEELHKNIESAFAGLSGVDPLLANRLIGANLMLQKHKVTVLTNISTNSKLYVKLASVHETASDILQITLRSEILWLAFKYDLITWGRILYGFRKERIRAVSPFESTFAEATDLINSLPPEDDIGMG